MWWQAPEARSHTPHLSLARYRPSPTVQQKTEALRAFVVTVGEYLWLAAFAGAPYISSATISPWYGHCSGLAHSPANTALAIASVASSRRRRWVQAVTRYISGSAHTWSSRRRLLCTPGAFAGIARGAFVVLIGEPQDKGGEPQVLAYSTAKDRGLAGLCRY